MCRFQCKDPETCQMPRFVVSPVKEPRHFVRNQNVKFFSPSSESDTDDEFDCLPIDQSSRAMCTAEEDSACSSDSGFVSRQSKENMMENEQSDETAQPCASQQQLKSILRVSKCNVSQQQQQKNKKQVSFPDECGKPLAHVRLIPCRQLNSLWADLVEIGPLDEHQKCIRGDQPWRVSLLQKLWADQSTGNKSAPIRFEVQKAAERKVAAMAMAFPLA